MTRPTRELVWLWAALAIPSWAVVARFTGATGVVVYSAGVAAALLVAPKLASSVPRRNLAAMSVTTLLAVILLFALVYPRVNVHTPNAGSDDDDAHNAGVAALAAGESPYSRLTYLGQPLHQLPGSFILAAPLALVGTSALQNLVCLPLFFVLIGRRTRDARTPLVLAWLVLLLSPAVAHQVVTGSSYSWNPIWVLCGIWWVWHRPRSLAAALFCGVAMCSRPNFLLLLAPVYGALARAYGRDVALRAVVIAAGTAIGLALPFYLASAEFGPLDGYSILTQFDETFRGLGAAILAATVIAAIGLSRVPADVAPRARLGAPGARLGAPGARLLDGLWLQCAIVQAIPVVAVLIMSEVLDDGISAFPLTPYASFASWFAVMGVAVRIEPWLIRLRSE